MLKIEIIFFLLINLNSIYDSFSIVFKIIYDCINNYIDDKIYN